MRKYLRLFKLAARLSMDGIGGGNCKGGIG
jgi:hypothetical protein